MKHAQVTCFFHCVTRILVFFLPQCLQRRANCTQQSPEPCINCKRVMVKRWRLSSIKKSFTSGSCFSHDVIRRFKTAALRLPQHGRFAKLEMSFIWLSPWRINNHVHKIKMNVDWTITHSCECTFFLHASPSKHSNWSSKQNILVDHYAIVVLLSKGCQKQRKNIYHDKFLPLWVFLSMWLQCTNSKEEFKWGCTYSHQWVCSKQKYVEKKLAS